MGSENDISIYEDQRFINALDLFNNSEWYLAHDLLEEVWYETNGLERITIQAVLQIAVAQVHLQNGNTNGATILYGEAIGRLRRKTVPKLGLNIDELCQIVEKRLKLLQNHQEPDEFSIPMLHFIN